MMTFEEVLKTELEGDAKSPGERAADELEDFLRRAFKPVAARIIALERRVGELEKKGGER
jgi:hypothetical protein